MINRIKTGFSPCPNDTYIFDAIVHQRVDTRNLQFDYFLKDVEELNQIAGRGTAHLIKVSCAHLPKLLNDYIILTAGGALGFNCGPLIITNTLSSFASLASANVAIPGVHTTANYLLSRFFPEATRKRTMLFSTIEDAVIRREADAGVIIHESRFTYESKGLKLWADLGALWHTQTSLPLPLGCIVASRSLPETTIRKLNRILTDSVRYAFEHPTESFHFVKKHASETETDVVNQHINLYVNELSIDLGPVGKEAIRTMLPENAQLNLPLFADEL